MKFVSVKIIKLILSKKRNPKVVSNCRIIFTGPPETSGDLCQPEGAFAEDSFPEPVREFINDGCHKIQESCIADARQ
jgi:hypothetical protein